MDIKFKEKPKKEESAKSLDSCISDLSSEFMNAATSLHKLHLKLMGQGSYAAHKALQFYDKFHDFADDLVESFQGASEKLLTYTEKPPRTLKNKEEGIAYLSELKSMIDYAQKELPYSEIINDLDVVKSEINSAKYKLLFLQ